MEWPQELDIVRRALALRKRGRIGILWAEAGRFAISRSVFDPQGSRTWISIQNLKLLVEELEASELRKPAASEHAESKPKKLCSLA